MSEEAKAMPRVRTVSELTAEIKSTLEGRFPVVDLEGEVSVNKKKPDDGLIPSATGHYYFTIKDADAQISAVLYKWDLDVCVARGFLTRDQLKDGAKVKVRGSVTVYPPRGNYQFTVKLIRPEGVGELMRQYLALKAKLKDEGLFDAGRKRPLPFLPRRIGIVTSEAGAVIHDMCTVLTRRFGGIQIRLYPSIVQGAGAPRQLIAGISYFQSEWVPDVLIVARGGGSFEDLFCFNDEALVRAVAASKVPVISAVGHETDFTLCDFAADVRAGTPSIAAEIAVPVLADLKSRISNFRSTLVTSLRSRGEFFAQRVDQLSDALASSLTIAQANAERRLERVRPRLEPALQLYLQKVESRLSHAGAKLTAYSPYGVLDRGYSLTTAEDGSVVKDAAQLKKGDTLVTRFAKGSATSVVA